MHLFKSKIPFRTYSLQKFTKWGLRVYFPSDFVTGFVSIVVLYFGLATTESLSQPNMPFTARIVLHLVGKLFAKARGSGCNVYTVKFYISFTLARQLLQYGVHLTATIQKNRVWLFLEIKHLWLRNLDMKVY